MNVWYGNEDNEWVDGWAWEANLKRESKEIALSLPPLSPPAQDTVSAT